MKRAKGFVISVYTGIMLLLISPVLIITALTAAKSDALFFLPYIPVVLIVFVITLAFGISTALKARRFSEQNETEKLKPLWLGVKLICVPAYIINFCVCAAAAFLGIMLFPVNIIVIIINSAYVFMCVILSGVVGAVTVKAMKKAGGKIHPACLIFQFIPFWDVVATMVIFIKGI